MHASKTDKKILMIAREILATDGLGAVSFDAIARRLGRSKQAVLYWYPTKQDLLAAMFVPWLTEETKTAVDAVAAATNRAEAIRYFIQDIAGFHLGNLDRFRMMYLVPQTSGAKPNARTALVPGEGIHQVTSRLYGALADKLGTDPEQARKQAVAIHSATLGLVLMFALTDALQDPLKHSSADLIEALVVSLTGSEKSQR